MTPGEVRVRVDEILARGDDDPESSHADEDALVADVLRAIAGGSPDGESLAREALRLTDDESLTRWYA